MDTIRIVAALASQNQGLHILFGVGKKWTNGAVEPGVLFIPFFFT